MIQCVHRLYRVMARIRCFEEKAGAAFFAGQLPGGVHLSIGQEGVAAGVGCALVPGDRNTSTHRGHGDLIAVGGDLQRMFAELLGRVTGSCGGKGGSMHIADASVGSLGANGIVGGGIPLAVGSALSSRLLKDGAVTVAFFGDGAVNTGSFHESLNLAAIWKLPVVFVCENNRFGQFSRTDDLLASDSITARASAYGISSCQVDGSDVVRVHEAACTAVEAARSGEGPQFIEGLCYRTRGHNEGDDKYTAGQEYRPAEEVEYFKTRDPLTVVVEAGVISQEEASAILAEARAEVEAAFNGALGEPEPTVEDAHTLAFSGGLS